MKDLQELFSFLNNHVEYVVLRNYENFGEGFLDETHPDIDILCTSRNLVIESLQTQSRTKKPDNIHRKIEISGKEVAIDLREVGDGYYCTEWEKAMLAQRVQLNNSFYTLDSVDYYYSLLYHALIHKKQLSKDYRDRLIKMGNALGIDNSQAASLATLEDYMRRHNYFYSYPDFVGGIVNFNNVDKKMVKRDIRREIRRFCFQFKRSLRHLWS